MVLLRTVAGTYLVVDGAVLVGQCQELDVTGADLAIGERLVARMILLILLVLFLARPVAVGGVTPDGVEGIAFDQLAGTGSDHVGSVVFDEFVLRVGEVECHLIAEVADAVVPLDLELPSPGLQFADVDGRHTDTDGVRQLQVGEHVVVIFPIVVERSVQTAVEQAEIDTEVRGLDGLPGLVLRSELALIVTLLGDVGGRLRDGGDVVVQAEHRAVTKLTP